MTKSYKMTTIIHRYLENLTPQQKNQINIICVNECWREILYPCRAKGNNETKILLTMAINKANNIVGFAKTITINNSALITDILVSKKYRNQNIGQQLIYNIENLLITYSISKMMVYATNPTCQHIMEKNNFKFKGEIRLPFYKDKKKFYEGYNMQKEY